jgi:hypothetical protein
VRNLLSNTTRHDSLEHPAASASQIKGVDSPEDHTNLCHPAASAPPLASFPYEKGYKTVREKGVDSHGTRQSLPSCNLCFPPASFPIEKGYKKIIEIKGVVDSSEKHVNLCHPAASASL